MYNSVEAIGDPPERFNPSRALVILVKAEEILRGTAPLLASNTLRHLVLKVSGASSLPLRSSLEGRPGRLYSLLLAEDPPWLFIDMILPSHNNK